MRAVWACLVLVVLGACTADGDRPGVIVLPGMVYSVPYDSYDRNPVTGQTLLLPPEGTVPYGFQPFPYGPGPEEALRAGRALTNPLLADGAAMAAHLRKGKQTFDIFCRVCHGPAGGGDGPIIGRFPNPPSLLGEHARQMADGQIYHVISRGQGLMPPYNLQVRSQDRWRLVAYVRSLQRAGTTVAAAAVAAPVPSASPAPPAGPADAAAETAEPAPVAGGSS